MLEIAAIISAFVGEVVDASFREFRRCIVLNGRAALLDREV